MPSHPGLSSQEAARLLSLHGPNVLHPPRKLRWLARLKRVLSEPTLIVLLLVLGFYVGMGSLGEAGLLGAFVLIVIAVTYVEEARTEAAVEALSAFASPRALALRDGEWRRVPGVEVVPGDLIKASEGDRVPADAEILEANDLKVDESLLSGESQAVWKTDDKALYAGTLVAQGQALARVKSTGLATRMGQVAGSLAEIRPESTPFQDSVARLVRWLAAAAALACALVVLLSMRRGEGWAEAVLRGLTLAIATVPEELPVILAVFMALGARALSRRGVLALHVPAVETLGALTLLAVDKTGTLTRNEMRLSAAEPWEGATRESLLLAAAQASEMEPFDPMERRILEAAPPRPGRILHDYALHGHPPRMGHVWREGEGPALLAVKGALEGVLEHCRLAEPEAARAREEARRLASQGMRVLGVAAGRLDGPVPAEMPGGLGFLGLLGFEDPLREGVPQAIARARGAGIRVVMMTGDAPETARAIASQLELDGGRVMSGAELEARPEAVEKAAREVQVFARMAPEHKLLLVRAWSAQGEVVGMTGDGVNDAPALTQAHVGVAMGSRGTDVAREASDLVLVDDSFHSLLAGVELGRGITRRILRAARFVLAVHVPIVGVVLGCLLLDLPPLIEAAQIAFLELFIGPSCSVVFERSGEDADVMAMPPRDPKSPLLSLASAWRALAQGGVILAAVMWVYMESLDAGLPAPRARAEAFFTLMLADFLLCWSMLSHAPFWRRERWANAAFWVVAAGVLGLLLLLLRLPFTAQLFHMAWLPPAALAQALAAAAAAVLWAEIPKMLHARPRAL